MKRLTILLSCLIQTVTVAVAQLAPGEWQAFMAYRNTSNNIFFNNKVYALSEGSLFSYNPQDEDILTYDLTNSLSDVTISHIASCPSQKSIILVYDNGNIDLMDVNEKVYNITDFKNSNVTDKTVNSLSVEGDRAYLSTNFGIVVLDIKKREIAITYTLGKQVTCTAVSDGFLLAATPSDGLYRGLLTDNLLDINKWEKLLSNTFSLLTNFNGHLYANIPGNSLLTINPKDGTYTKLLEGTFTYSDKINGKLAVGSSNRLYLFDSPTKYEVINTETGILDISYGNSTYWISRTGERLAGYQLEDGVLTLKSSPIEINAPTRNLFYQNILHNDKLYTCGGGIYLDRYRYPGTIQVLDNNGTWKIYQDEGIKEITGKNYWDITSLAIDPTDESHVFAASAGEGLYEFRDGKFVTLHTPSNSGISGDYRWPYIIRIDGLAYDKYANLWALCACADSAVTILTSENRWLKLPYEGINRKATLRHTFFDRRGWMWAVTPYHAYTGIFILDYNGTIENRSDDHSIFIEKFTNQDGERLEALIYCAIEDHEGSIWLGTGNGMWLISNPKTLLTEPSTSVTVTQVKVPRNDGTNYADYLLAGITVKAIAVDGANRKWVGTENNGIYLLSADGIEEIHHFTTENSPLLSDEIQSIAVDNKTGLVYIATSKGLTAYQSDATEAQPSFEESKVRAFPNPVNPDYQGTINIVGLMMDSQVKITDSSGNLVHEGTSTGGSFSWDGRNSRGRRVASGVYHVMATDADGKEGIVTKIVIVN